MAKKKFTHPVKLEPLFEPRMSADEKEDLFVHLLRCPTFFDLAVDQLQRNHFEPGGEEPYVLVLYACQILANESGITPRNMNFRHRLKHQVLKLGQQFAYDNLAKDAATEVAGEDGLIAVAFDTSADDLDEQRGQSLLKRFLNERTVLAPLEELLGRGQPYQEQPKNLPAVLEKLVERVRALERIDTKANKTLGEEWQEHQARLKQYRDRKLVGLRSGLVELDKRTLGLRGLFLFGAKPGAGKTTYADVQVAVGVCRHFADNDAVVVILSLDMDRFELYRRIECNLGDIGWKTLMFGSPEETRMPGSKFSEAHKTCLQQAKKNLAAYQIDTRIMILDRSVLGEAITARQLCAILADLKARAGAKHALLIVDYLQLLPVPDDVAAGGDLAADKYRVRLVQQVIENTRTAEDPLGDTALVISEARKPANARQGWGEAMSELMGSARLGYAADAVLLYREMTGKEIEDTYGVTGKEAANHRRETLKAQGVAPVVLILDKGRDGMTRGKWPMEFHFEKSVFVELQPGGKKIQLTKALLSLDSPAGDGKGGGATGGSAPKGKKPGIPLPDHLKKKAGAANGKTSKKPK